MDLSLAKQTELGRKLLPSLLPSRVKYVSNNRDGRSLFLLLLSLGHSYYTPRWGGRVGKRRFKG